MVSSKLFLALSGFTLILIGVLYGAIPEGSMALIFQLNIEGPDSSLVHMLRGFSGIYCGMGIFWIIGAVKKSLTLSALWSVLVFMLAVALGRIVSFCLDGIPMFWGFNLFLVCEMVLAVIAAFFIKKN